MFSEKLKVKSHVLFYKVQIIYEVVTTQDVIVVTSWEYSVMTFHDLWKTAINSFYSNTISWRQHFNNNNKLFIGINFMKGCHYCLRQFQSSNPSGYLLALCRFHVVSVKSIAHNSCYRVGSYLLFAFNFRKKVYKKYKAW